jgi:hypothetical protein
VYAVMSRSMRKKGLVRDYARLHTRGFESDSNSVTSVDMATNGNQDDVVECDVGDISVCGEVLTDDTRNLQQHVAVLTDRRNQLQVERERTELLMRISQLQREVADLEQVSSASVTRTSRTSGSARPVRVPQVSASAGPSSSSRRHKTTKSKSAGNPGAIAKTLNDIVTVKDLRKDSKLKKAVSRQLKSLGIVSESSESDSNSGSDSETCDSDSTSDSSDDYASGSERGSVCAYGSLDVKSKH